MKNLFFVAILAAIAVPAVAQTPTHFIPMTSCRAIDTRNWNAYPLWPEVTYAIEVAPCFVPPNAKAVHVTLTVTGTTGAGFIGVWGSGPWPGTSAISYERAGQTISTSLPVKVVPGWYGPNFSIIVGVSGAHVIVDVLGYYVE